MNTTGNAILKSTVVTSIALLFVAASALAAKPEAGTYKLDPAHSKVGFEVTHLAISTVEGKFNASEGTVEIADNFEKSKVTAEVDIKSVDTGNGKRDDHLKSPDFFESEKFPKMTFKSTSISGTPDAFKMTGDLTIKGKTKSVVFEGKYTGSAPDGSGNLKAAFQAKTKISRKEFGVSSAAGVVGDEVSLDLKIQAGKAIPKK